MRSLADTTGALAAEEARDWTLLSRCGMGSGSPFSGEGIERYHTIRLRARDWQAASTRGAS